MRLPTLDLFLDPCDLHIAREVGCCHVLPQRAPKRLPYIFVHPILTLYAQLMLGGLLCCRLTGMLSGSRAGHYCATRPATLPQRTCHTSQAALVQISTPGDFAVPGSRFYTVSRPSDYMLTHLKRFAEEDTDRHLHWAAVLEATVRVRRLDTGNRPTLDVAAARCQRV